MKARCKKRWKTAWVFNWKSWWWFWRGKIPSQKSFPPNFFRKRFLNCRFSLIFQLRKFSNDSKATRCRAFSWLKYLRFQFLCLSMCLREQKHKKRYLILSTHIACFMLSISFTFNYFTTCNRLWINDALKMFITQNVTEFLVKMWQFCDPRGKNSLDQTSVFLRRCS